LLETRKWRFALGCGWAGSGFPVGRSASPERPGRLEL
jgi:hypothetical protein